MKIEWASNFNADGSRKKPAPSTMHGWLAKMRGTLLGDETLRSRGMREMRDATAYKQRQKEKARKARGGRNIFSIFLASNKTAPSRPSASRSQSHRSQTLRRPNPPSRKSSTRPAPPPRRSSTRAHLTRSSTSKNQPRPTPRRRNTTR